MKRYSHLQFIDTDEPDSVSMMYPMLTGEYVKHEDAELIIDGLVEALRQLKKCDLQSSHSIDLNEFITQILRSFGYE